MVDQRIPSHRRYYLLKRLATAERHDFAISSVWQAKQEAESGTALPATFPHLSTISACGYTTEEDLDGADAGELIQYVGLNSQEAAAVISAAADL